MNNTGFLEFEVVPERCLKNENVEFHIGTPINQVITMLQQNARILPNISLYYSNKDPFNRDVSMHLCNGIKLSFDAQTQLLKLIEVLDLSKIILKYGGQVFSEPGAEATQEKVEECFGSTHPGEYDENEKVYTQRWRGLSFSFPTNNSLHVEVTEGFASLHSLKYDSISAPRLMKMTIFKGASGKSSEPLEVPLLCYCGNSRLLSADSISDEGIIKGMSFTFLVEDKLKNATRSTINDFELVKLQRNIYFGDHVTKVLAALGAPSKVFYKSDDKMSIHKGGSREVVDPQPHFFFNYFSMGFDILFDFTTKRVIKFVLHNNVPGHFHFGVYARCEFRVECSSGEDESVPLLSDSKYSDFSRVLQQQQQPVVIHRPASETPGAFGSTYAYGLNQVVVEVMDNSHIASVTVFEY